MKRREFLISSAAVLSYLLSGCEIIRKKEEPIEISKPKPPKVSKVYVLKTEDRGDIERLMGRFNLSELEGKAVALKANYNSADPFPATTHLETLSVILDVLNNLNAKTVLAERSGMGKTARVLEKMGVMDLAAKKDFRIIDLDSYDGWILHKPEESHWRNGYPFADVFLKTDYIIQTCCLKTHRFGGHFTMSLKNSVGMVAKYWNGHNYMAELHGSKFQRKMIAEINLSYSPFLVIMDAIKGFSHGGPERGTLIEPGLIIASNDRVAVDAVGVALLRIYGTTHEVSKGSIFEQEQISRALELELSSGEFEIIAENEEAEEICREIEKMIQKTVI
jgi:uncharacterized protein (DUF362 family)